MRVQRIVPTALLLAAVVGVAGCSDSGSSTPAPTATSGTAATATRTATTAAQNTPTHTLAVQPTATNTPLAPTATETAAATATQAATTSTPTIAAATDTPTGEATATPTPTAGEATPTETSTPSGGGLGIREFTVTRPGSALYTSALGGFDASMDPWIPGVLKLAAGTPDENGVASLQLAEDVILGSFVADGSVACTKLFAAGSNGTLACNGGVPQSVTVSQDSNEDVNPGPVIITLGQGDPSPAGSAYFTVTRSDINLAFGAGVSDCLTADFSVTTPGVFTTDEATATVENSVQGAGTISLSTTQIQALHPQQFDCSDWTNASGPGRLSGPVVGLGQPIAGDVANIFFLAGS